MGVYFRFSATAQLSEFCFDVHVLFRRQILLGVARNAREYGRQQYVGVEEAWTQQTTS